MVIRNDALTVEPKMLCTFRLEGTRAASVALLGSFNGWSTTANLMEWRDGRWEARVMLPPGRQEYCFFVLQESADSIGGLRGGMIRVGSVIDVMSPAKDMTPMRSDEMIGVGAY